MKVETAIILITGLISNQALAAKMVYSRPTVLKAMHQAADDADVPYRLLEAICTVESSLNANAKHPHDGDGTSYGLCQIKEATAREMGFEAKVNVLMDPSVNAYYAAKYLRFQMDRYEDDWIRAVAAYNKGSSHYRISNQEYVNKVLAIAVKI